MAHCTWPLRLACRTRASCTMHVARRIVQVVRCMLHDACCTVMLHVVFIRRIWPPLELYPDAQMSRMCSPPALPKVHCTSKWDWAARGIRRQVKSGKWDRVTRQCDLPCSYTEHCDILPLEVRERVCLERVRHTEHDVPIVPVCLRACTCAVRSACAKKMNPGGDDGPFWPRGWAQLVMGMGPWG
jgi:hypothetical protein